MRSAHVLSAAAVASSLLFARSASAAPVVDGTRDAEYGGAVAVQTIQTGFGDNLSELDAAYARVEGGRLYLMLTGNIEANFNKLEIFIDSAAGGENQLTAAGLPNSEASVDNMAGLTFDTGFAPDYLLFARRGSFGGDKFDLDYLRLGAGGTFSSYQSIFGNAVEGAGTTGTGANSQAIGVAYNNANTAGVGGATGSPADQTAAQAVTTGLELSIALADIGSPVGPINIAVFQNNSEHNYLSNQSLAGLPAGTNNLGGDGAGGFTGTLAGINFNNFAGSQFFTVPIPEPVAVGLLPLLGAAIARRGRRSRTRFGV